MRLLAIDTTTKYLCLGVYDGSKIYEYNLELGAGLSSKLAPSIERVLKALKYKIEDIDYFACGLGPGSFTGVRVGLSTIKAIAWSLNKPVVGVSTLDILARNAHVLPAEVIVPVIDAKRSMVYSCIYRKRANSLKRISPYMLSSIEDLLRKIKRVMPRRIQVQVFGDGAGLYKQKIEKAALNLKVLEQDYWRLSSHNLIQATLEKIAQHKIDDVGTIRPVYLYPKECQIRKHKSASKR